MLLIVGIDAISRQHDGPVSLVGVDGRGADTSVRVDSGKDDGVRLEFGKYVVEPSSKERAITLLYDDGFRRRRS